jgi:hypothetical protein
LLHHLLQKRHLMLLQLDRKHRFIFYRHDVPSLSQAAHRA